MVIRDTRIVDVLLRYCRVEGKYNNEVFLSYLFDGQLLRGEKPKIFEKCVPTKNGLLIPGSAENSDLAASTGIVKRKLKTLLLSHQNSGNPLKW